MIQVKLQQDPASNADFGVYFRNQPGNQPGTYAFLIHPDGTWGAYVYDNNTGKATRFKRGTLGVDSHAVITVAIVVGGSNFAFYANGNNLAAGAYNPKYTSGTTGIALDQGAAVTASNFELYTPAS